MDKIPTEIIATGVSVEEGMVRLTLLDGSSHSFPARYYPKLSGVSTEQLGEVCLRVGGRALRWENLDEDIWIADAVLQNYPPAPKSLVAEAPGTYQDQ